MAKIHSGTEVCGLARVDDLLTRWDRFEIDKGRISKLVPFLVKWLFALWYFHGLINSIIDGVVNMPPRGP